MTEKTTAKSKIEEKIPAEVRESARKIWFAGLGALSAAEEEGSKLFRSLVEKGEQYEAKGRDAVSDVKHDLEETVEKVRGQAETRWDRIEDSIDERSMEGDDDWLEDEFGGEPDDDDPDDELNDDE